MLIYFFPEEISLYMWQQGYLESTLILNYFLLPCRKQPSLNIHFLSCAGRSSFHFETLAGQGSWAGGKVRGSIKKNAFASPVGISVLYLIFNITIFYIVEHIKFQFTFLEATRGIAFFTVGPQRHNWKSSNFASKWRWNLSNVIVSGFQEGLKPDNLNSITETPIHKVSFISMIPRTKTIMQIIKGTLSKEKNDIIWEFFPNVGPPPPTPPFWEPLIIKKFLVFILHTRP